MAGFELPGPSETDDGYINDDSSTSGMSSDASSVYSLLSRLRSPTPSELSRKRKIRQNPPPPSGIKRGKGHTAADPKSISPADRVKSFPNECLTVSCNKLFCRSCREEVALKKSIIEMHIKSQKHVRGKVRIASNEKHERDIAQALQHYDNEVHPEGENLPEAARVYWIKVITAFLKAGVALSKLDNFRDLLEEHAFSLSAATNLRQLLPFILRNEIGQLKRELAGKSVSIIFDGTTHVCEAMVVVLRYVTDDWAIKQSICRLMLLAKSMSGEEIARQIITALSTELGIASHLVIVAMRDRASVNEVAMRTVTVLYNRILDVGCFSHTLDNVGGHMRTPVLDEFSRSWIGLFSRSPKARLSWRSQTGLSSPSFFLPVGGADLRSSVKF